MMDNILYMHRALQLAALGIGKAQPNPLVGAVVVHNEKIIGEGFHQQYGAPHAEVNAINAVENQQLFKESTLYVNLEPCSHVGKTPPCTSFIIEKQIPKVVIGMKDPNEKVNGSGILTLRDTGIEIVENVLSEDCARLNKRFVTFHTKKRPYVFLKWAQTKNGFMEIFRKKNKQTQYWITNNALRVWAHKLRNEEQAILIGYNTYVNDAPQLTNRLFGSNQPKRYILSNRTFQNEIEGKSVLVGTAKEALAALYSQNIQSVIIEGGKKTLLQFLETGIWDEAFVLSGNVEWKKGIEAPKIPVEPQNEISIDGETIFHYVNK